MTKRKTDDHPSSSSNRDPKALKVDNSKNQHNHQPTNMGTQQNSTPAAAKLKKPKPIFVNAHISQVKRALDNIKFEKQPDLTYRVVGTDKIPKSRIYPVSVTDKKTAMTALAAAQLEHWSYSDVKLPTYALKYFYKETPDTMVKILKDHNLPVKSVSIITKGECPVYATQFSDMNINLAKLTTTCRQIEGINIRWENLRQSKKRLTQCYNCQRWGHSSANCGFQYRCVACGSSDHKPKECPRKSLMDTESTSADESQKEPKEDPKCCNCGGNHTANSRRSCQAFKDYAGEIKKIHTKNAARRQQLPPNSNNQFNDEDFPTFQSSPSTSRQPPMMPKAAFERSNLRNIVNPPKPKPNDAPKFNNNRQSYRDAFSNNSGESQNHSQPNQCNNCISMENVIKQLQQQIHFLTNQVAQLMHNFPSNQQMFF